MAKHSHGHVHMSDIIDSHHPESVKHEGAKTGVGGLAPDQSDGYEEANRNEAFKKGGKFSGKSLSHYRAGGKC